jgi:hypothetical protein
MLQTLAVTLCCAVVVPNTYAISLQNWYVAARKSILLLCAYAYISSALYSVIGAKNCLYMQRQYVRL